MSDATGPDGLVLASQYSVRVDCVTVHGWRCVTVHGWMCV